MERWLIHPRFAPLEYLGLKFLQTWEVPDLYVKAQILGQERFQYDCVIDYDMMGPVEEFLGTRLKYPDNDVPMVQEPAIKTKEDMKKINWNVNPRKDGNMPKVLYVIRRLKDMFAETQAQSLEIQSILASIREGLCVLDKDDRIILSNQGFHRIVRQDAPDGRYFWEVVRSSSLGDIIRRVASPMPTPRKRRRSGTAFSCAASSALLRAK
jgi:PAS domain-containing protein